MKEQNLFPSGNSLLQAGFGCAACRKLIGEYSPVDLLTSCDGLNVVVNVFFFPVTAFKLHNIFMCRRYTQTSSAE